MIVTCWRAACWQVRLQKRCPARDGGKTNSFAHAAHVRCTTSPWRLLAAEQAHEQYFAPLRSTTDCGFWNALPHC